jgi:hypothetical protein
MSKTERRRSLLLAALAFVIVMIVWQVPDLSTLLYPFRYFVTTIHELGHGIAAMISDGRFIRYEVFQSGAGVATTAGGSRLLVIPAGYVGTALFGASLLFLANRTRRTNIIAVALGIGFGLLTLLFARNVTAVVAGILTAAILFGLGWKAPLWLTTFVLNLLAILTGLNAVLDLWGLLRSLDSSVVTRLGNVSNDAYHMAQTAGVLPAAGWAVLWMLLAFMLLGTSVYWTFWRPFVNNNDSTAP